MDSLCGQVVHTAFEESGSFECSNELLNKIQQCVHWSTLTNYHGIPTDCPHREKNGWTGDAMLSAEQVLMNFDPMTAYTKWMKDFRDIQRPSGQLPGIVPTGGWGFNWGSGPAWDSAALLIPWYMYVYCGDIGILQNMYETMKKYVDFVTTMSNEYIVDFGLGDWCPPEGGTRGYKCPSAVTDTAYYYVDAGLISKVAGLLNKSEDQRKYACLAENIGSAFRRKFLNTETGAVTGECQTSAACVLYQGLINEDEKGKVLGKLVEYVEAEEGHIDCGILGAKYLLHTLTEAGRADLAYEIANQTTFPGWGYWIAQGATTLWESWKGDASRNHHMFSDIGAWFYKGLAGINPDPKEPGFKHVILRPGIVPGLTWVNSSHQSMYGRIECNWKINAQGLEIKAVIPVNCHASLYIPLEYSDKIEENGVSADYLNDIKVSRNGDEQVVLSFETGVYNFTMKRK
jgi:alpha-L-rhamnosidase